MSIDKLLSDSSEVDSPDAATPAKAPNKSTPKASSVQIDEMQVEEPIDNTEESIPTMVDVIKTRLSFVLTLISIVGLFALAFIKGVDITSTLPLILGVYVASKSTTNIMHSINASKDPRCNTAAVISKLNKQD